MNSALLYFSQLLSCLASLIEKGKKCVCVHVKTLLGLHISHTSHRSFAINRMTKQKNELLLFTVCANSSLPSTPFISFMQQKGRAVSCWFGGGSRCTWPRGKHPTTGPVPPPAARRRCFLFSFLLPSVGPGLTSLHTSAPQHIRSYGAAKAKTLCHIFTTQQRAVAS